MAEILIKAVSHSHPDFNTDSVGCYKKGDPVVVMEDDHQWGKSETLPKFVVVKIPGVSVDAVREYLDESIDEMGNTVCRRKYHISEAAIEYVVKQGGTMVMTKNNFIGEIAMKVISGNHKND